MKTFLDICLFAAQALLLIIFLEIHYRVIPKIQRGAIKTCAVYWYRFVSLVLSSLTFVWTTATSMALYQHYPKFLGEPKAWGYLVVLTVTVGIAIFMYNMMDSIMYKLIDKEENKDKIHIPLYK